MTACPGSRWLISLGRTAFAALFVATFVMATGCDQSQSKPQSGKKNFNSAASRARQNDENLTYALRLLRDVEAAITPDSLTAIVSRLNLWGQQVAPQEDWKPDPLLLTLPAELRKAKALQGLAGQCLSGDRSAPDRGADHRRRAGGQDRLLDHGRWQSGA